MQSKLDQWLDSKVDDNITSKYDLNEHTLSPYYSHYAKNAYYTENDTDMKNCDQYHTNLFQTFNDEVIDADPNLTKMSEYMDHLYICPNSNRYHANYLFRMLVDYSNDNNFDYKIYNENTGKKENVNLMDVSLKKSFYEFCFKNK